MTVTVYHLKISAEGQLSKLVMDKYYDATGIGRDKLASVADIIRNAAEWQTLGLTYEQVATVDTNDLDKAYEFTNHIDQHWWDNPRVTVVEPRRHRSTSVGDLMHMDGKVFMVDSFGFTEVAV